MLETMDCPDWAIGELLALFSRSARNGVPPHLLDPERFSSAWRVLNAMPFDERIFWHRRLMAIYDPSLPRVQGQQFGVKRYAYSQLA